MKLNPRGLLEFKSKHKTFKEEHPDMGDFGKTLAQQALMEGSVFELTVTNPFGKVLNHKLVLTENDLDIIRLFIDE